MALGEPGGARVAAIEAARRRAAAALPDGLVRTLSRMRGQIAEWGLAEVAPGRLLPWLPVAFGTGIVLYLSAAHEPTLWAAIPAAALTGLLAYAVRHRPIAFPLALALAGIGAGFAIATIQTARIAHPVLQRPVSSARLSGFVEVREGRERSDRITLRLTSLEARRIDGKPERVRLAIRKHTAPSVGTFVSLKAHLSPPLAPLRPGGYDFARDMYVQQIGASGYALGRIKSENSSSSPGFWIRYASILDTTRKTIDDRIHAELTGDRGAIASALITGTRDAISAPVNDAMYVSSLAHVLSISGYHMAVVAGIIFFVIRGSLALVPALATRRPIKKWAAAAALVTVFLYMLLSGSEVATQRSFVMIAIVLVGIMLDRATLTFRTISIAALCILVLSPQAVAHPSFQMSFAATLALIAAYQRGLPWTIDADTSRGARIALWGLREIVGLILASTVAGLATTPYAAFHFHRLAPYGVLANLFAMPVVSALVMPMGILGVVAVPFGFDGPCWQAMGIGIDWMIAVVLWVAHLPGAIGRIHAFGSGPLLLGTAGLLLICLLRTPLRLMGGAVLIAACAWALLTPQPDVLISADGQTVAVRGADGRLALLHSGRDRFALKEWLAADADGRPGKDASLSKGVACDPIGCTAHLADGRLVAVSLSAEAFAEDCARAAIVVSPRTAPPGCAALTIDHDTLRARGALALRSVGKGFERSEVRPAGYDRPWARAPEMRNPAVAPVPADATPRLQDLGPED
jgi:competence protein ComEC